MEVNVAEVVVCDVNANRCDGVFTQIILGDAAAAAVLIMTTKTMFYRDLRVFASFTTFTEAA